MSNVIFLDITAQLDPGFIQPYAFTGREWDPETSLYYYRARYYDPKIGRFISEDPIRFAGGINFYGYVGANPVRHVDPFGLADTSINAAIRNGSVDTLKALADNPGLSAQSRQLIQQALQKLQTPVRDLIRGTLKRSRSYRSEYEDLTYEALRNLARTNKDAARMLKLIKEDKRLLEKLGAWFAVLCGWDEGSDEEASDEE